MATHSSTLSWKIQWTEGGLQSMGSLRIGHNWATSLSPFTFLHWRRQWQPTPVFLPGESQGRGSLVGCRLWGRTVEHDWSNLAAAARNMNNEIIFQRNKFTCSNVYKNVFLEHLNVSISWKMAFSHLGKFLIPLRVHWNILSVQVRKSKNNFFSTFLKHNNYFFSIPLHFSPSPSFIF